MSLRHPINPSDNRLARPRILFSKLSVVLIVAAAPFAATAQTSTTTASANPPRQCASEPARHDFDFWIGEWDVTTKDGTPVGGSVIQLVSRGCALLENWTSVRGGQGKSLNAYNPLIGQWQQFWIGADGGVNEYRSSKREGAGLAFLLRQSADADSIARLTFTPIDSATVRQHSELSADGGRTWVTQYDFYYHRRSR
jgi:hypothetical protein